MHSLGIRGEREYQRLFAYTLRVGFSREGEVRRGSSRTYVLPYLSLMGACQRIEYCFRGSFVRDDIVGQVIVEDGYTHDSTKEFTLAITLSPEDKMQ